MMQSVYAPALAAGVAAALVFVLNRKVQPVVGVRTLLLLTPLWEETFKAGLAYTFGAALWPVHLCFGGIEAIIDWCITPRGQWRHVFSSLLAHLLFGLFSTLGAFWPMVQQRNLQFSLQPISNYTELGIAWLVAVIVHGLWNCGVLYGMQKRSPDGL